MARQLRAARACPGLPGSVMALMVDQQPPLLSLAMLPGRVVAALAVRQLVAAVRNRQPAAVPFASTLPPERRPR
jgi:hypothetical protein